MDFEEWWAKQTANFDPEEIGLMQLARITWNAAQDVEREACAQVCDAGAVVLGNYEDAARAARSCAAAIRLRANVQIEGLAATRPNEGEKA